MAEQVETANRNKDLEAGATAVLRALEPRELPQLPGAIRGLVVELVAIETGMRPPYRRFAPVLDRKAIRCERRWLAALRKLDEGALAELCRFWAPDAPLTRIERSRDGWRAIAVELSGINPVLSANIKAMVDRHEPVQIFKSSLSSEQAEQIFNAWHHIDSSLRALEFPLLRATA